MNSQKRTAQLAALACAVITLMCLSACCTKRVGELGRFREVPGEVMCIVFDNDASVLIIDYRARAYAETGGAYQRNAARRLRIPYDRLDIFHQCAMDCSSSSEMLVKRQLVWWRDHPDFVLPSKIWAEPDGDIGMTYSARSLRIRSVSEIYDSIGFAEAVGALRKGEAVVHDDRIWLPHGQEILSVDLPYREDTKTSARIIKPVLYPFAVVGDILLSPAYLILILTWPRI